MRCITTKLEWDKQMWFLCQISSKKKKPPKQTVRFFCVENSRMESEMSLEINENRYINIYTAYKGEKNQRFFIQLPGEKTNHENIF